MKQRNRKKVYECAHYHEKEILVTDDPYKMYDHVEYCGLNKFNSLSGKYPIVENSQNHHPCRVCKKFKLCNRTIRDYRNKLKQSKMIGKYFNYLYKKYSYFSEDELDEITQMINFEFVSSTTEIDDIVYDYKNMKNKKS